MSWKTLKKSSLSEMLATRTVPHFLSDHQSWALLGCRFLILRLSFWNELNDVKLIVIILNLLNRTKQRHSRCQIFQTCLCYGKKLDEDKVLKDPMFAVCNRWLVQKMPRLKDNTCQFIIIYFCLLSETDILLETHHGGCERYSNGPRSSSSTFQTDWTNSFLWEKRTYLSLNAKRLCVSALLNVLTNARTETLTDCPDSVWAPADTTSEDLKTQQSPIN